jgi:FKBP-type peptidyl-prolyl cis-trans isomerase
MPRTRTLGASTLIAAVFLGGVSSCQRGGAGSPPASTPPTASPAAARPDAPTMSGTLPVPPPPPPDVFAPPADAERDPSGVARKILTRGTGSGHPTIDDYVELRYAGWQRNGVQFEGTGSNGESRRFEMKELVAGLSTDLTLMVEGEKRRLWVPAALAYGKRTNYANAPKGDMTYEVELVRIIRLPPVPDDVAAAPKQAKTTKSGLAYRILVKGKGKRHPTEDSRAEVVYTAWTAKGQQFQTSYIVGDVIPVRLKLLPPGWREAMLHMVEGDKWRLWLPGKLAFGELQPGQEALPFGPPPGPVVFDVELVRILE